MNQSRRQFAATLLAGGVSLFLPKTIAPVRWKVRTIRFMNVDQVDGMQRHVFPNWIEPRRCDPVSPESGDCYFNQDTHELRAWVGGRWVVLFGPNTTFKEPIQPGGGGRQISGRMGRNTAWLVKKNKSQNSKSIQL